MRLYHSSNVIVESPDTQHSRNYLDFGRCFCLASIYEQAVRYAQRFKRRGLVFLSYCGKAFREIETK